MQILSILLLISFVTLQKGKDMDKGPKNWDKEDWDKEDWDKEDWDKKVPIKKFTDEDPDQAFDEFEQYFQANYSDESERQARKTIFKENMKKIKNANKDDDSDDDDDDRATYGITKWADKTEDEYKKSLTLKPEGLTFLANDKKGHHIEEGDNKRNLQTGEPINFMGNFQDVRDQGWCGSCVPFAVAGAIEGNRHLYGGPKVYLSTQELLDCDYYNYGCNGGWPDNNLWYVYLNGIRSEENYPYVGYDMQCNNNAVGNVPAETGIVNYHYCNFDCPTTWNAHEWYLENYGPVVVAMDAGEYKFSSYTGGIYSSRYCNYALNHAVVLVGQGINRKGKEYYIIRNSWGTDWGINGYAKIMKNASTASCLIELSMFWPDVQAEAK